MSVLVYVETSGDHLSKNAIEAVTYGASLGGEVIAHTSSGASDEALAELGKYGATKVLKNAVSNPDPVQATRIITQTAEALGVDAIVMSHDHFGKGVAPRVSAKMKAGLVSGAVALPEGDKVKVNVFSGKAFGYVKVNSDKRVITVLPNSIRPAVTGEACPIDTCNADAGQPGFQVVEVKKQEGDVPLTEAELVVSGGRGLKGPENWGMIEDLAKALGAATACSRPVADVGWRPHHEHVGQTGIAIRPNLYIAAGISGAIQHLAGVNGSKTIVVINNDKEAPFFKAADYGVVGDAFEVVPRLLDAVKKFKGLN